MCPSPIAAIAELNKITSGTLRKLDKVERQVLSNTKDFRHSVAFPHAAITPLHAFMLFAEKAFSTDLFIKYKERSQRTALAQFTRVCVHVSFVSCLGKAAVKWSR